MDERQQHQRRRASDRVRLAPIVWAFIGLTVVFFSTCVGFAWVVHDVNDNSDQLTALVAENQARITDIQTTRIESCERTYEGIREVFSPFFPKPPLTQQQLNNLERFNKTIADLRAGCVNQTGQEGG